MTVPLLLAASQLADFLSFPLALGHGTELNPFAVALLAMGGLWALGTAKALAAVALGVGPISTRSAALCGSGWLW